MKNGMAFRTPEGRKEVLRMYDALLEQWSAQYETIHLTTRYGKTFVLAGGDPNAPPLILLHGSGMNSVMWLGDMPTYTKHFRVYAVDIPGEPGKSAEEQLPFDSSAYAEWLDDVLKALAIDKANIIGISLGAWLAIKYAVFRPEKVEKLVLLCPSGVGPQKGSFLFTAMFYMCFGDRGLKKLFYKVNGNQPIPDIVLDYQLLIGKSFNFRREMIPIFSDQELKSLTMPVILFAGGKDIMLHSAKTARRMETLVPQGKINILPEAGHTLTNLTTEIYDFLIQE
ncbi:MULTISPECIES: alpha/beta hydrolase [unclassified Dehalobacter]|uniref:alpha/beta fold hydrolase n=1 Tax=unclassified Dehalobacter TaxID=2635733 RepID=UPI000E6BE04F|nr:MULTISPECIES: alpha/beta hydrolase [unclassified Dehalobacter]RJE48603.1 Ndr family protein [Dehalobacter sp. MCB1]TCX46743.1 alpha/beta hydrolase [Dehalobacter sp. 14DCB1]TCX51226.1 alpha/beta hydrolase [Dehalobacter sp. 12DCB1]